MFTFIKIGSIMKKEKMILIIDLKMKYCKYKGFMNLKEGEEHKMIENVF